tara:strand:- start:855 stop:995 length:141 start_codon:yes stop_codon:yes gene_type:complete
MNIQELFSEAEAKYYNGYSESRLVDFVFGNANNDAQAAFILSKILS